MDKLKQVGGFVGSKVKDIGSAAVNAPSDLVNHNIGKEKVKVKFEITLKSANNLEPQFNGRNVFIEWKRGSNKERTGTDIHVHFDVLAPHSCEKVSVRDKCAIFEEAITFECTLYQHSKKKTFEEKHLECSLKEFLGKKSEDLYKTKIDLATFGQAGSYQFQSIPFKSKRKDIPSPTLLVSVKSTWMRVGDKKVVKGKGKDKDHSIELDGEAFGLETDMNASAADTSIGGGGGSDDSASDGGNLTRSDKSLKSDKSVLSEVKDTDPPEKQAKKLRKAVKKLEKENRKLKEDLENTKEKSRERLRQVNSLKKEALALKKYVSKSDLDKVKKTAEEIADVGDEAVEGDASFPIELVKSLETAFKKSKPDCEPLVQWLAFVALLYDTLERDNVDLRRKEDLPARGVPLAHRSLDAEVPISKTLHALELLLFEVYTSTLKALYARLDATLVPYVIEQRAQILQTSGDQPRFKQETNLNFILVLTNFYEAMRGARLFPSIVSQFFAQALFYCNARIFNYLLKRRDLCTCGMGFQIKFAVSMIEDWALNGPAKETLSVSLDQLGHLREVANLLVLNKAQFADQAEAIRKIFSLLNPFQLKQLLDLFSPDNFYKDQVPPTLLRKLDTMCQSAEPARIELDPNRLLAFEPRASGSNTPKTTVSNGSKEKERVDKK